MDEAPARRLRGTRVSFNGTPMIDVVFQLLLFFLLSCHFLPEEGQIRANLPRPGLDDDGLRPEIDVALYPSGPDGLGVLVEVPLLRLTTSSMARLHRELEVSAARFDRAQPRIVVRPRGTVRWQHVVDVFHQAARAGFRKVCFGPAPRPGGASS